MDMMVLLEHKESQDPKEIQVKREAQAIKAPQEIQDLGVIQEHQDKMEKMVMMEPKDHKGLQDQKEIQVKMDIMD